MDKHNETQIIITIKAMSDIHDIEMLSTQFNWVQNLYELKYD